MRLRTNRRFAYVWCISLFLSINLGSNICHSSFAQPENTKVIKLIYFLPTDRISDKSIDTKLDILIKDVQQIYANRMESHGFGRKTFTFETDTAGNAVIHHVAGKSSAEYYYDDNYSTRAKKVWDEFKGQFDFSENIHIIVLDSDQTNICGLSRQSINLRDQSIGKSGQIIISLTNPNCFNPFVFSHELGHTFGLEHDFRDNDYLMSYGGNTDKMSACAAKWLDASKYFNHAEPASNSPTVITLLPPTAYPSDAIAIRFDITDKDILHQAHLLISAAPEDRVAGMKLYDCKTLSGETHRLEFFVKDSTSVISKEINLLTIDINGNMTIGLYTIEPSDILPLRTDVNTDGIINILDLVLAASFFGDSNDSRDISNVDVNRDNIININDLILIANAMTE